MEGKNYMLIFGCLAKCVFVGSKISQDRILPWDVAHGEDCDVLVLCSEVGYNGADITFDDTFISKLKWEFVAP